MSFLLALLYVLCCSLLVVAALLVYHRRPHARLHQHFALASLAIVLWLATLFLFQHLTASPWLLWIGRLNFASVLFIAQQAYLFMGELTEHPVWWRRGLLVETWVLAALTLLAPVIDRAEIVEAGEHVTRFGVLFPLYILHVVGLLGMAGGQALVSLRTAAPKLKHQLALIATGLCASALVALTTNLLLPYVYGLFGLQEVGALSILFFIVSAGYAITVQHLLDVRIVLRKTLVYAILFGLVEKVYSDGVDHLIHAVPAAESTPEVQSVISLATVLFIAVTFDPLRHWLEALLDRVLSTWKRRA